MVTIELDVEDLANMHFAISPLGEVAHSLWALTDPSRHTVHLPWLRLAGDELDPASRKLLQALVGPTRFPPDFRGRPSRALPDFLTPRPTCFCASFDEQLAAIRETPLSVVRRDLLATHAPGTVPECLQSALPAGAIQKLLDAICDALDRYWQRCLAPFWPRMQLVLEGDTTYRARRLANGGAHLLFADIDPSVHWDNGTLSITEMVSEHAVTADGRGLLLIPSIFAIKPVPPLDARESPWLVYPSRGTDTLWEPQVAPQQGALVDLLGRTRAVLMEMLDEPLPTIELARRLGVTPSAVSQHLQILYRSGLVTRTRDRRTVLYRRSGLGEQLIARR